LPTSLTEKQKQLLTEFEAEEKSKNSAADSNKKSSSTDKDTSSGDNFSLKQAWSRLTEFLSRKEEKQ
jgi:hypothetical protein